MLAQAALKVAERGGDETFLAEALDRCKRYYLWLRDHRDPDADGLVSCITPYETGMDHLPAYDEALGAPNPSRLGLQVRLRLLDAANLVLGRNYRLPTILERGRFNVEDVLFNCLYAEGLRCVARLCAMGRRPAEPRTPSPASPTAPNAPSSTAASTRTTGPSGPSGTPAGVPCGR